jgi:hypothetical protein
MAIIGDRCAVQTLTSASAAAAGSSTSPSSYVRAAGEDDDSCPDVIVSPGDTIVTTLQFAVGFDIPCSDYGVGEVGVVKLQVCSSYHRSAIDDDSCDDVGPYPSDPDSCWCDAIDVPGVTMLSEDMATPTCEPTPYETAMPSSPYDNSVEMVSPFPTLAVDDEVMVSPFPTLADDDEVVASPVPTLAVDDDEVVSPSPTPVDDEVSGANVTPQAPVPEVCCCCDHVLIICARFLSSFLVNNTHNIKNQLDSSTFPKRQSINKAPTPDDQPVATTIPVPTPPPVTTTTTMAIMDVMETCADAAVMSDVVANDISDGSTKLKLTVIVADGKNGSCVVSGEKKRGV